MDSDGTPADNDMLVVVEEKEAEGEREEEAVTEEKKLDTCRERMLRCSSVPVLSM